MNPRSPDLLDAARVLMTVAIMFFGPGILLVYPFLVGGTAGLFDLIALTSLVLATYWYLSPPAAISSRWLLRSSDSEPAVRDRIFDWLDEPVARQSVLSAWPPMLGVLAGRVLALEWRPPRGPMILYVAALAVFVTVSTITDVRDGDAEVLPTPTPARLTRGILWSASIASFLWFAASLRGHVISAY